jgi:hypothetical protein
VIVGFVLCSDRKFRNSLNLKSFFDFCFLVLAFRVPPFRYFLLSSSVFFCHLFFLYNITGLESCLAGQPDYDPNPIILNTNPIFPCRVRVGFAGRVKNCQPYARQTKHHLSKRRVFSSGPPTVSRSFCSSLHPSGRLSSPSRRLSVIDQASDSFQVQTWED